MTYIEILVTVALNENFMTKKKCKRRPTTYSLKAHFLYCINFWFQLMWGKKFINQKLLFYFLAKKIYVYVGQINTSGESKNYKLLLAPF